eukprot:CAMPEP_0169384946 /NCGR_PEP_ID=MMETSP1017-20121227/43771_1 /TAXON_ID=342587 /ORGANISM="Karlodinium micrum, Strain CCMP2283" /LENGTH=117 /DNA_ID=CAMNT_0009485683 /DNA_START=51 /DNA_END=404 /DNA_ORIENTATION=+
MVQALKIGGASLTGRLDLYVPPNHSLTNSDSRSAPVLEASAQRRKRGATEERLTRLPVPKELALTNCDGRTACHLVLACIPSLVVLCLAQRSAPSRQVGHLARCFQAEAAQAIRRNL